MRRGLRLLGTETEKPAIEQTSGRERINIHGAIDLATGQTRMIEVVTVDAASTIRPLELIAALYPMLGLIHVFLDMRAIIMPSSCRNGLRVLDPGSSCISFLPIARI